MTRRTLAILLAALVLGALTIAGPASAGPGVPTTWYYPTTCATVSLQACVANANAGDTVLIDTNEEIAEFVTISKDLHLGATVGYDPVINGGVMVSASSDTIVVTVDDLTVYGTVQASFQGGTDHVVTFDHLDVRGGVNTTAISVYTTVPATASITSSMARYSYDTVPNISIHAAQDAGTVQAFLAGNFASSGHPTSGPGIAVYANGDGETRAHLYNNAIWKGAKYDGPSSAGIFLSASGVGTSEFDVVGNTVDRVGNDGLRMQNALTNPGHVTLDLFDNLFANPADSGVAIQSADTSRRTIHAGSNAFVNLGAPNDWDGASSGTTLKPSAVGFVAETTGDLRLRSTSPLVDAGVVCTVGGLENLDAAGRGRLAGPTVDVGAYERGATAPKGEVWIGTGGPDSTTGGSGSDIYCGLGGNDVIEGGDGRDYIDGGAGADVLLGDSGPDRLLGGKGSDPCLDVRDHVGGNDVVDGGKGIDGGSGDDGDTLLRVEGPAVCQ
jgi:hemolysin type calcium-binding protein